MIMTVSRRRRILAAVASTALAAMTSPPRTSALAASRPSRVAVLGATGKLGRETVRQLLDRDIPVRCLVRPSSVEKLPGSVRASPLVEVVPGELLAASSLDPEAGVYRDDLAAPSDALSSCLEGCDGVVACYGATRRTKLGDVFRSPEDVDPAHSKQINYRSMIALARAAKAAGTVRLLVRVTGKGEDPAGIFSVLLNGLGSFAKAWNYQGEVVLRTRLKGSGVGYAIVRPGVMRAEEDDKKGGDGETYWHKKDDLVLRDDGGNDLRVTPVTYPQIAGLMVDLLASGRVGRGNDEVTLAAMNPSAETPAEPGSLPDKIAALRNDRREFPASLVAEHKAAVRAFFTKVAVVMSAAGAALLAVAAKLFS